MSLNIYICDHYHKKKLAKLIMYTVLLFDYQDFKFKL